MAAVYKDGARETGRFALPYHAGRYGSGRPVDFWMLRRLLGDASTSGWSVNFWTIRQPLDGPPTWGWSVDPSTSRRPATSRRPVNLPLDDPSTLDDPLIFQDFDGAALVEQPPDSRAGWSLLKPIHPLLLGLLPLSQPLLELFISINRTAPLFSSFVVWLDNVRSHSPNSDNAFRPCDSDLSRESRLHWSFRRGGGGDLERVDQLAAKERAHTADQAASAQASRRFTTCIAEKMAAVYKDCTQETGRFALPCHADHCGFWIVCQLLGDPSTSR